MTLLLMALGVLAVGGFAALLSGSSGRVGGRLGAGAVLVAAALGCKPILEILLGGPVEGFRAAWPVPVGEIHLELDALSAWFLGPTLLLSALSAVYGTGYMHGESRDRELGVFWFWYCGLVLSMCLVLLARDAVLFLFAWELMAIASFFLVTFEHNRGSVREAGWIYMVATHLGTAFLLVIFFVMARETGSMDFNEWASKGIPAREITGGLGLGGALFLLAIVGFGTKAGFMPFHVWLPEAHPAAPSPVSAVMSGVMIKTGIYGLVRALTWLGMPSMWWGWVMVGIGLTSGVLGVLFALAQHDLKRLLAYHSVENIGIIALGLGVGLLGMSTHSPALTVLGFGGGLLHVVNHALFKGLLFLGAGAVLRGTGTMEMDRLGGLLKRMRWTGMLFLVGATAISGLPPLNGFVSEFLIFLGALQGSLMPGASTAFPLLGLIAGLGFIGGLAAACFAKAFGVVFLGEPRAEGVAALSREPGWTMRVPMLLLAAGCIAIGLFGPAVVRHMRFVLVCVTGLGGEVVRDCLWTAAGPLEWIVVGGLVFVTFVAALAFLRWLLLSGRDVSEARTWGCGYERPTARMQYTASSFAQPLLDLFRPVLRTRTKGGVVRGLFPKETALHTVTPDLSREELYRPGFQHVGMWLSRLRWLQHGNVQMYVLYVAVTLLVLLAWKFR